MKKTKLWLTLLGSVLIAGSVWAQTQAPKETMPVDERMAKARAAKADKKRGQASGQEASNPTTTRGSASAKATSADYSAPVVKSLKGPNGEVVHTGEKGGKYYINKNGNKTYLSSNQ